MNVESVIKIAFQKKTKTKNKKTKTKTKFLESRFGQIYNLHGFQSEVMQMKDDDEPMRGLDDDDDDFKSDVRYFDPVYALTLQDEIAGACFPRVSVEATL